MRPLDPDIESLLAGNASSSVVNSLAMLLGGVAGISNFYTQRSQPACEIAGRVRSVVLASLNKL